ncbi:hypothetical protein WOLCODRAFT_105260 [Wolfiporia cocos MD-104 SS10]|uniref:Uncharacterized protein n=1 Tax=Wolfiporia cocos (strain MD-104) TaxID=742152 RepID=A0A2H3JQT4_WOLCO|nr:hypothetical protein WOLCODRAFT_105260 [Wolfiporia cocos MD-104 SS10]
MSPPAIEIGSPSGTLPTCTPYLMPFHIAYSGPAPVATYFRAKPAPPPSYGKGIDASSGGAAEAVKGHDRSQPSASGSSQSTLVAASSSATLNSGPPSPGAGDKAAAGSEKASLAKRFIAAFRGRTVQGLEVALPKGYTGLVLHTPEEDAKPKRGHGVRRDDGEVRAQTRTRNTRRSAPVIDVDAQADDEHMAVDGDEDEEAPARVLRPAATFSSFVLWNQDIPVDEGRDEYLRTLSEWTRLAAEIHRAENDADE